MPKQLPDFNLPHLEDGQEIVTVSDRSLDLVSTNAGKTRRRFRAGGTYVDPQPVLSYVSSIVSGTLKGTVTWVATITVGAASKVEFYIDGKLHNTEFNTPFDTRIDTTQLSEGHHAFAVLGYDAAGKPGVGGFAGGTVLIDNISDVPVPDPTPTPVPTPGGGGVPTTDPAGWKRLYATGFDTDVAEGSWPKGYSPHMGAYPDGWSDTSKHGYYAPRIISCHDSLMDLHIRTENGKHLVAVPTVTPNGLGDYSSGRIEMRWKIDGIKGYKTAWLWWPKDGNWPHNGEIDYPERNLDSNRLDLFVHLQGASSGSDQWNAGVNFDFTQWHTTALEWRGGQSVEAFLDGKSIGRTTNRVPNTPMHFVIQTETALDGSTPADGVSGHVLIDYLVMQVPG